MLLRTICAFVIITHETRHASFVYWRLHIFVFRYYFACGWKVQGGVSAQFRQMQGLGALVRVLGAVLAHENHFRVQSRASWVERRLSRYVLRFFLYTTNPRTSLVYIFDFHNAVGNDEIYTDARLTGTPGTSNVIGVTTRIPDSTHKLNLLSTINAKFCVTR